MIIDTHAHYDDEAFDEDREALLASLLENGIEKVIDVCASPESVDRVPALAAAHENVYAAVGIHPDDAGSLTDELFGKIRDALDHPKTVAVGEIGLDYYWNKETKEVQEEAFRRQALLAISREIPVIIHSREAAADTMEIVRELYGPGGPGEGLARKGVMHCYSYSAEQAVQYVRLGFCLGIGGVVTFKNARKLKEAAAAVPAEALLLETDCPYLAPVPYRGKRNSSLYLPYVAEALASIRGVSAEEIIRVTKENAERLFAFPHGII